MKKVRKIKGLKEKLRLMREEVGEDKGAGEVDEGGDGRVEEKNQNGIEKMEEGERGNKEKHKGLEGVVSRIEEREGRGDMDKGEKGIGEEGKGGSEGSRD